jgi:hypothetical protein
MRDISSFNIQNLPKEANISLTSLIATLEIIEVANIHGLHKNDQQRSIAKIYNGSNKSGFEKKISFLEKIHVVQKYSLPNHKHKYYIVKKESYDILLSYVNNLKEKKLVCTNFFDSHKEEFSFTTFNCILNRFLPFIHDNYTITISDYKINQLIGHNPNILETLIKLGFVMRIHYAPELNPIQTKYMPTKKFKNIVSFFKEKVYYEAQIHNFIFNQLNREI